MRVILDLGVLLALVSARTEPGGCGTGLHCPSSSPWQYQVGRVYSYTYRVATSTVMKGASDQQSSFAFSATAEIGVASPCNLVLRLSKVQGGQEGSTQAQHFAQVSLRHSGYK